MNTQDAIKNRRSIKHYDANHKMTAEEINDIISLAMLSPTAFNLQHWRFVQIEDSELRQQMRAAAGGQAQMTDASLLIVLCADLKAWQKSPERYWQKSPQAVQDYLLPLIGTYYKDRLQVERDDAMRSCGIAAQSLMLAAQSM
ncbi:MAG: nitroreductase family protein, partial [Lentisphaeraceae bacterium]|nr:nitroreductase family protein [Lentisphaeraceae bacterium]